MTHGALGGLGLWVCGLGVRVIESLGFRVWGHLHRLTGLALALSKREGGVYNAHETPEGLGFRV